MSAKAEITEALLKGAKAAGGEFVQVRCEDLIAALTPDETETKPKPGPGK